MNNDNASRVTDTAMSRRALMTGTAALTCVPVAIMATPSDPHVAWLEEWKRLTALWTATEEGSDADHRIWDERGEIEKLIMTTPATTAAGLAAQVQYALDDDLCGMCYDADGPFHKLDLRMFENIRDALQGSV